MRNARKRTRHALAVYDNGHDDPQLRLQLMRLEKRIRRARGGRTNGEQA
jgi:hypothetical protein